MGSCEVCKNPTEKKCGGCKNAYYCTKICQQNNWKVHKHNCGNKLQNASIIDAKEQKKVSIGLETVSQRIQKLKFELEKKDVKNSRNQFVTAKNTTYRYETILGKGDGVRAIRNIRKGETILTEWPILRFKGGDRMNRLKNIYKEEFQILPKNEKEAIMKLMNSSDVSYPTAMKTALLSLKNITGKAPDSMLTDDTFIQFFGIWSTNIFDLVHYESQEQESGLFIDASKFNHSCIANAEFHFTEPNLRIYAVQDIEKGEEICIRYFCINNFKKPPTIAAEKELISTRFFNCKCELCEMNDTKKRKEIEKHRIKYWELEEKLQANVNPQEQLKRCEDALHEMKLAKMVSLNRIHKIAHVGWLVALICNQNTKVDYLIEQDYASLMAIYGENDPRTKHCWNVINNPIYRLSTLEDSEYRKEIKDEYLKSCTISLKD